MRKAPSTKIADPIPVEFEKMFVERGWERCSRMFGKRAMSRYVTALGSDRLRADRRDFLDRQKIIKLHTGTGADCGQY